MAHNAPSEQPWLQRMVQQVQSEQPGKMYYGTDSLFAKHYIESIAKGKARILTIYKVMNPDNYLRLIQNLFPEKQDKEIMHIAEIYTDEDFVKVYTNKLYRLLRNFDVKVVTPWTVELTGGPLGVKGAVFDPYPAIEIVVTVRKAYDIKEKYTHSFTEELLFGILSVVSYTNEFEFSSINVDVPWAINIADIAANTLIISSKDRIKRYTATIPLGNITFDTVDVIQGVITGASWIREDPHKYIWDIRDNGVLVTF